MGAAREFRDLDFIAARDDFERLRASGANPGAIVKIWRAAPPTPEAAAAVEPPAYTPAWFKWVRKYKPEMAALYMLDDQADDDQAPLDLGLLDELVDLDDELLDDQVEDQVEDDQ